MKIVVSAGQTRSLIGFRYSFISVLAADGHEVTAIVPNQDSEVSQKLGDIGVKLHVIPLNRASLSPFSDGLYTLKLYKFLRAHSPDIFFAYTMKPSLFGVLAAKMANVPRRICMLTGLGIAFTSEATKARVARTVIKLLSSFVWRDVSAVIFHNDDDRACAIQSGLVKAGISHVVNGSGVETDHFAPAPYPKSISFLFIGRLLTEKGIREFVEAAHILHDEHPEIMFRIVGGSDANPGCVPLDEIESWQAFPYIEYLGVMQDVRTAIAASSVFVLPSYREGRPRSTLEAMSMARPIITTDAPGCRQTVIEGRNGYLAPVGDSEALAEHMKRFVADPALVAEMGQASRKLAVEEYDIMKVNQAMIKIIGV